MYDKFKTNQMHNFQLLYLFLCYFIPLPTCFGELTSIVTYIFVRIVVTGPNKQPQLPAKAIPSTTKKITKKYHKILEDFNIIKKDFNIIRRF
jgi:hypothetical protein